MARCASWLKRLRSAQPVSVFLRAFGFCAIAIAPLLLTTADLAAARRFPHAVVRSACGAFGGPASELYLLDEASTSLPPKGRHVHVGFQTGPESLERLTVDADAASQFCQSGKCVGIWGGTVTFESFKADKTLVGRLDLRFVDGTEVRQEFRAQLRSDRPVAICE